MATLEQMEKKRSRQVEEILAAVRATALDIGQQTNQVSKAIGSMADEIVNLKVEIAELKIILTTPGSAMVVPAGKTRRPKK